MQNILMQYATQDAVKKRFRGHKALQSKITPRYRANLERDFLRVIEGYIGLAKKTWKKYSPVINEALKKQEMYAQGYRTDARKDEKPLYMILNDTFDAMQEDLIKRIGIYDLTSKIERVAALTTKLSIEDWKRMCQATLGIDLLTDYYSGEFFAEIIPQWVDLNVNLIVTIPKDTLAAMNTIVEQGFYSGARHETIAKEIEHTYNVNKSHAKFIARDQLAKLNGDINRKQQSDAGVTRYIWCTVGDQRVRDSHKKLNGKVFSWDNPPIVDEKTGRRCHPMQDYQCRCVAKPVFDIDTINLPMANGKGVNG